VIDPENIVVTVGRVLELGEHPDRSSRNLVADSLREKSAFLILDNCEHIIWRMTHV